MYFLYILKSDKNGRHYIGISKELHNRLSKHNSGSVTSTKAYRPWKIVHTEKYEHKTEARKREIHLKKTAMARTELFAKIENGPIV